MCQPDYETIDLPSCSCRPSASILVEHGFFPTAPTQPHLAISIDFLEFYYALFEQSADAVGAMAAALSKFYNRRGFPITNAKVSVPKSYSKTHTHLIITGRSSS
jgi:hypothetical protein